jgi:AGCS family alanine or glycine:cation symporter
MPKLLAVAVFIFAYSTMISWSYYGERAVEFLLGQRGIMPYRVVYLIFVVLGPILSLQNVIDFADIVFLSLAVPNILGMIILSGKVRSMLDDYVRRLRAGELVRVR